MKKILLTLTAFAFMQNTQGQHIKLKFQINKIHYLVNFVEAASGHPFGSKHLRRIYKASPYNTPQNRRELDRFRNLNTEIVSYKYPGYPKAHLTTTSIWDLFKMAAARTHSLADLKHHTAGMYPTEIQTTMFEVFTAMTPAFEQLLWKPHIKEARAKLAGLEAYAQKNGVPEKFQKLARFYGSRWNSDLPFVVNLLPLPASYRRGSSAGFRGNMLTCDFPLAMKNKAIFLGIVIHELSHILYEQQPLKLQQSFESWFAASSNKYSNFSQQWINEALATACGNAWFFEQLTDSLESGAWYGNPYIDKFARKLYPEVSRYISAGKRIDQAFVNYSIGTFARAFPKSLYDYDQWMNNILMLHSLRPQELKKLEEPLYNNFRIQRNHSLSPLIDKSGLAKLAKTSSTNLIVVSRNNKQSLRFLQQEMEGLKQYRLNPEEDFLLTYIKKNHTPVILVNVQSLEKWGKVLATIRKLKQHNPAQPLVKL